TIIERHTGGSYETHIGLPFISDRAVDLRERPGACGGIFWRLFVQQCQAGFSGRAGERAWVPCGHGSEYKIVRDGPRGRQHALWGVGRDEPEYDHVYVRAAFCAPWQERHVVCSVAVRI